MVIRQPSGVILDLPLVTDGSRGSRGGEGMVQEQMLPEGEDSADRGQLGARAKEQMTPGDLS